MRAVYLLFTSSPDSPLHLTSSPMTSATILTLATAFISVDPSLSLQSAINAAMVSLGLRDGASIHILLRGN